MKHQLINLLLVLAAILISTAQTKDVSHILKLSDEDRLRIRGYIESCYEETGANESDINKFQEKDLNTEPLNENCFFACYHKKVTSMDEAGFYTNLEVLKDMFSPKNYKIVVDCSLKYNSLKNVCTKAFKCHMCYLANRVE